MADEPFARIRLKATCFGLDAHPTEPLLAAGLISGQLKLFDYEKPAEDPTGGSAKQRWSARPHSGACRAVRFASDGNTVYSTGADGTLQQRDVETNKPTWRRRNAASATINALALTGETGVATGDDEGMVRCWDMRQRRVAQLVGKRPHLFDSTCQLVGLREWHRARIAAAEALPAVRRAHAPLERGELEGGTWRRAHEALPLGVNPRQLLPNERRRGRWQAAGRTEKESRESSRDLGDFLAYRSVQIKLEVECRSLLGRKGIESTDPLLDEEIQVCWIRRKGDVLREVGEAVDGTVP